MANCCADTGLRPGSCSRVMRSTPRPQATSIPSFEAPRTVPTGLSGRSAPAAPARFRGRHRFRLPNAQLLALKTRLRDRPGIEGADLAFDRLGILAPIDERLGFPDLRRIADAGSGLRLLMQVPALQALERFTNKLRRRDARGGPARTSTYRAASISIARASSIGPVSSPASMRMIVMPVRRIAGENRALNRSRAAPARQQRGVNVETAQARYRERRGRQNAARRPRPTNTSSVQARRISCASRDLKLSG